MLLLSAPEGPYLKTMKTSHAASVRTAPKTKGRAAGHLRFKLRKGASLDKAIVSVERGNRVVIGRGDEDLAALVPLRDYRLLLQLSSKRGDVLALLAALDAEAVAARKGEEPIPWETARQRLQ